MPPLRPTAAVALGRVTEQGASKLEDYAGGVLFYVLVPCLTVGLFLFLRRLRMTQATMQLAIAAPLLLALPLMLTTLSVKRALLLPLVLSGIAAAAGVLRKKSPELFLHSMRACHVSIASAAVAAILTKTLIQGRRLSPYPFIVSEVVVFAAIVGITWVVILSLSLLFRRSDRMPPARVLSSVAAAASAIPLLPLLLVFRMPIHIAAPATGIAAIATALAIGSMRNRERAAAWLRSLSETFALPALLFSFVHGAVSGLLRAVDLFHRGEAAGPAFAYLRGAVPYADVFVLHGLLEDGFLDAMLMRICGESMSVINGRIEILSSVVSVLIYFFGRQLFGSWIAGLMTTLLHLVTSISITTGIENYRGLLLIASSMALLSALRTSRTFAFLLAGLFAGIGLFFSLDTGMYALAAGLLSIGVAALFRRRIGAEARLWRMTALYVGGAALGMLPFALYLAVRGALDDFAETSFVTVPGMIDAVWSFPYPDLTQTFWNDPTTRTIVTFVVSDAIRFVFSPLALSIAAVVLLWQLHKRRLDDAVLALIVVSSFALLLQRTALGRADYAHQLFASLLLAPLVVALIRMLISSAAPRRNLSGIAAAAAIVSAIFIVTQAADLLLLRIELFARFRERVFTTRPLDDAEAENWRRIAMVTDAIQRWTRQDETIFDFSNQPAFYFYAKRKNPTRFYQVPILSPKEFQIETIRELEAAETRLILRRSPERKDMFDEIHNDRRAPLVASYIDRHYAPHAVVAGVEIWMRR